MEPAVSAGAAPSRDASLPIAPSALGAHVVSFSLQEDPDLPVPVARVLRRERPHVGHHQGISNGEPRLVPQRRAGDRQQGARAAARQAARPSERNLPRARVRLPFFRVISLSTSISRSRSATIFFSRPFPVSICRSRLPSAGSKVPTRL